MPNPSAQYKVRFDGKVLPGYLQAEDMPIEQRDGRVEIINRDGGPMYNNGTNFRGVILHFNLLSRLSNNSPGIAHLGDCLEQYREAAKVTRVTSASTLFFGATAHYLLARAERISAPLAAPDSKRVRYSVEFTATPWFYGNIQSSNDFISVNGAIVLNMPDTRRTYPVFGIPSGLTAMTVSHTPSGKSFTFSGSHAVYVEVDCARLTVKSLAGTNFIGLIVSGPDFGIYHVGSGSSTFNISGVGGQGTVNTTMIPRLER